MRIIDYKEGNTYYNEHVIRIDSNTMNVQNVNKRNEPKQTKANGIIRMTSRFYTAWCRHLALLNFIYNRCYTGALKIF